MSTQADYSNEEWNLIVAGPALAGATIMAADPAIFGSVKESAAMAKAIAQFSASSAVELIQSIGASVRAGHKFEQPDIPKDKGSEGAVIALIGECQKAVEIVREKSAAETEGYAQFLLDVARITAESSKEGGFLGIGSVRVSEKEMAALERLADALELPTPRIQEG